MSLRRRLSRLEEVSADALVETFFRRFRERRDDAGVSAAADEVFRVMAEADAAAGRALTPAECLRIPGIDETMQRLISALNACEGS